MYTTLISDCDGVLIDSEVVAHEVLVHETQTIFPSVDVNALLLSSFGQKTEELVRQVAQVAKQEIPDGFLKHLRIATDRSIEQHSLPVADVDVLVNSPYLEAVVSNSGMARIMSAVNKVGLSKRTDVKIFSADMVTHPKPAADVYLFAAQKIGVMPQHCVVLEDSVSGVQAAMSAGMAVIGFVGGLHIPEWHAADLREMGVAVILERLIDLPNTLHQFAGWKN